MASDSFSRIQTSCLEGRSQSIRFLQKLFHSLHSALKSSEQIIKNAISEDSGYNDWEISLEYALAIFELRTHYESLDLEQDLRSRKRLENRDGTTHIGIVYVIPSKHNLFFSVISAITAAFAAGNCIILELPVTLTRISGVLRKILSTALDADVFTIVSTRLSKDELSRCYILAQTEDGLIPQNLCSKGSYLNSGPSVKAVAIVDRSADIHDAALSIGISRTAFDGHSAYSPDLVLVNEFVADDFLFHLIQAISSPLRNEKENRLKSSTISKGASDAYSLTMKELESNDSLKVVVSGESGSIVEINNRARVLLGHGIGGRVITIYRSTSLDDAIDLFNGSQVPLQASYLFAAATEANYLSRFIDARITCINHIPSELLVGPFAEEHPTIAPHPSPRYSVALFRSPRPRLSQASELSTICQNSTRSRSTKELDLWCRSVLVPVLPEIKQRDGKASGFFDQAFMIVGITVATVLAGSAFTLYQFTRRR